MAQQEIPQSQMFDWIKQGQQPGQGHVTDLTNEPDASTGIRYITGVYHKPSDKPGGPETTVNFKVPVDLQFNPYLMSEIQQAGYKGTVETVNNTNIVWPLILNFLPIVLFVGLMYFLFRQQIRMAGKSAFSFGKSKARMMTRDRNKVTFKDVAGIDEPRMNSAKSSSFSRTRAGSSASAAEFPRACS